MKGIITVLHTQQALLMHFACSIFTVSSQGTSKQKHNWIYAGTVQQEVKKLCRWDHWGHCHSLIERAFSEISGLFYNLNSNYM